MPKKLSAGQWREISQRIFRSWNTPGDIAECVARSLVDSDLCGIFSHGVLRIPAYYRFVLAGWLQPAARPMMVSEGPAVATIDGNWGFGQPAMDLALEVGLAKSRDQGIAGVGVVHCGHIGRLGEYAEKAAAAGKIALVTASGGPSGGLVVPFGGAQRVLGTNPIGAGVPAGDHAPFIMDYATSTVAAGKIEYAHDKEQVIPEGWAVDAEGRPARTVRDFLDGGGLLPMAGHKGYALAMFIELLCGGLTGAGLSERPDNIPAQGLGGNACFLIVLDVAHFTEPGVFGGSVDAFFDRLKRVKPAPGSPGVMIPGEPERQQRAAHEADGIAVEDATWNQIRAIAQERGVELRDVTGK
jgi:hydroxycarboxylate dehydrogenase B